MIEAKAAVFGSDGFSELRASRTGGGERNLSAIERSAGGGADDGAADAEGCRAGQGCGFLRRSIGLRDGRRRWGGLSDPIYQDDGGLRDCQRREAESGESEKSACGEARHWAAAVTWRMSSSTLAVPPGSTVTVWPLPAQAARPSGRMKVDVLLRIAGDYAVGTGSEHGND